ncbi:MAG: hypothetical protein NTY60_03690 [Proteobacteria bacterium]|nr:hypothetical protein [Pseudomonadota bacterium]
MSELNPTKIVQLNLATEQRNAGRDYHEYFVPGSIKLVLATWPKAKLDEIALDNSIMFRYRFGFEPTETVRKQVLEIKNQYDFTDREIRWLRHSGQLSIATKEAKLKPTRLMPMIGWSQVVLFSMVCVGMVMQIIFSTAPAWKQALGEITVAGLSFGVFWVLNSLYIAPWRTLKRSGVLSSTAH